MLLALLTLLTALALIAAVQDARAHLHYKAKNDSLTERIKTQRLNLKHARYVCMHGARAHKRWACKARVWLLHEIDDTWHYLNPPRPDPSPVNWVSRQIYAADVIGRESAGDPWPNCPDPYDGGGSWQDTVNCENGGNWYDSPGYYRCGLQFDPMWERRFGQLCP